MTINANVRYRQKDLLKMGYKPTQISTIVDRADVFQGMQKTHGYAIEYNFNQAFLMALGCELLSMGISFRHVNRALFLLSNIDFYAQKDAIKRGSHSVLFYYGNPLKKEKGFRGTDRGGKNMITGDQIILRERVRTQQIEFTRDKDEIIEDVSRKYIGSIIIRLYNLVETLEKQ